MLKKRLMLGVALVCAPLAAHAQAIMSLGTAGSVVGEVQFNNATSGTITLAPPTGALGAVTLTVPDVTSTLAALGAAQTWTGAQTFGQVYGKSTTQSGTTYTVAATDCGTTILFSSNSAVTVTLAASVAPASGTMCWITMIQQGTAKVSVNGTAVTAATLVSAQSYTGTSGTTGAVVNVGLTTVSAAATAYLTGNGS